jgi:3D (Asp-Asp-Asp) domain-containing protein
MSKKKLSRTISDKSHTPTPRHPETLRLLRPFCLIIWTRSSNYGTLMIKALRFMLFGLTLLLVGCAVDAEKGKTAKGRVHERKVVKTTAYTDSESGARRHSVKNAIGSKLRSGATNSAAADWSHFPVGTKFRIVDTDQTYVVDDYGSALIGTDTIDLYVPSRRIMDQWGVRRVTIEVLEKGSYQKSLEVLIPRQRSWCARQMVRNIQKQIDPSY